MCVLAVVEDRSTKVECGTSVSRIVVESRIVLKKQKFCTLLYAVMYGYYLWNKVCCVCSLTCTLYTIVLYSRKSLTEYEGVSCPIMQRMELSI